MCEECFKLQADNARLRKQVKCAKEVIRRQKKQLDDVRGLTWKIMKQAERAMLDHLPRGTWSLWKGRGEAAYAIFRIVIIDWARSILEEAIL